MLATVPFQRKIVTFTKTNKNPFEFYALQTRPTLAPHVTIIISNTARSLRTITSLHITSDEYLLPLELCLQRIV